jgi:hypothetical protein
VKIRSCSGIARTLTAKEKLPCRVSTITPFYISTIFAFASHPPVTTKSELI